MASRLVVDAGAYRCEAETVGESGAYFSKTFATDNFNICFKDSGVDFQRVRHILRYKGQILRKISVVTSEMESNTISASASISLSGKGSGDAYYFGPCRFSRP